METDASGVVIGAALLQVKDNLSCGYDEGLDNAVPIAFDSESLPSTEWQYSNI